MTDTASRKQLSAEVDKHLDSAAAAASSPASIDVERLNSLLMGTWGDIRREAREFVKDPALHRRDGLSLEDQRERVLTQLHLLVEHGAVHRAFPIAVGGLEDNGGNITAGGTITTSRTGSVIGTASAIGNSATFITTTRQN